MTRNIIAEFSSSLDANGNFKKYQVVTGSTFIDEYSETLDTATILLAHVKFSDRLQNIKPYDFCRVYDKTSETSPGVYSFDHTYLVDNYTEKEDRIKNNGDSDDSNRIFSYTINLMSETKLLEKIQCPSLTITHDVKDGTISKKTIFEKICEYMELYVPKIKKAYLDGQTTKWRYEPLIEIPGTKVSAGYVEKTAEFEEQTTTFILGRTVTKHFAISELVGETVRSITVTTNNENVYAVSATFDSENGDFEVKLASTVAGSQSYKTTIEYEHYTGIISHYVEKSGYHDFYTKFNVPCADMGSSNFTLRQVLSTLMQQVGCIPSVRNLKMGFLDFSDDAGEFALNGDETVNNTVNYVQKSLSSDSFVNSLVNMPSSVLDSGNEVISETLGFRDKDSVVLKQQSNLFLETKFPIYKVNEFKMNMLFGFKNSEIEADSEIPGGLQTVLAKMVASRDERKITLKTTCKVTGPGGSLYSVSGGMNAEIGIYNITTTSDGTKIPVLLQKKTIHKEYSSAVTDDEEDFNFDYDFNYYMVSGNVATNAGQTYSVAAYGILHNLVGTYFSLKQDITPLIKESGERSLLEKNYKQLHSVRTLEDLSKFVYGTVGYTIGGKTIEGFSSYFSETKINGLFTYEYGQTYIEAIYEWLSTTGFSQTLGQRLKEIFGLTFGQFNFNSAVNLFAPSEFIKFTQFTFDIKYQPLNSFNLSHTKRNIDIDFPIEQYSGSDSGLTDFDRLSLNQQEQVDRIGNEILSISQRIAPENFGTYLRGGTPFKPVYYNRDGIKYTVYKRTFTVGNYKYDVNYIGSKDAILKNYFTTIRTKYRAYEYINYNQSTLRKEKDIVYVRIGEGYYDGDDKIHFQKIGNVDGDYNTAFISGAISSYSYKNLKYECETSLNSSNNSETVKNDISLITNDNCFGIIYEQSDNISAGSYVASSSYSTYYDHLEGESEGEYQERLKIGGVPQAWQMWNTDVYNDRHVIFYTSNLKYYDNNRYISFYSNSSEAQAQVAIAAKAPILPSEAQQIQTGSNVVFVCDNNKKYSFGRTFYKDKSERLNHTVQFIYYAPNNDVKWTENFIKNNSFSGDAENLQPNAVFTSDNMNLNKELHTTTDEVYTRVLYDTVDLVPETANEPAHILVTWRNEQILKVCYEDTLTGKVADFIAFKRPAGNPATTKFYVTLNDTKSDYVMDIKDNILYRAYKVKLNDLNREVIDI